jgi:ATP-binding cassette, sub-family E, member 1
MDGFIPSENLRFRETSLSFNIAEKEEEEIKSFRNYEYPSMKKTLEKFTLHVEGGSFTDSEIIVLLGENGTGKSTFIRLLAGNLKPDESQGDIPILNVSYKPQILSPKFDGTVNQLIMTKIRDAAIHPQFKSDVLKPLDIQNILHREVKTLSGGELQRVALTLCLGKPADVYLIDEPSAYLDAEQRINAARVIKRFVRNSKKMAFIVEHDFIMATYLADRVVVFEGQPSSNTKANAPQSLLTGINDFLKNLNVTFRRDRDNFRPRINKLNGAKVKIEDKFCFILQRFNSLNFFIFKGY